MNINLVAKTACAISQTTLYFGKLEKTKNLGFAFKKKRGKRQSVLTRERTEMIVMRTGSAKVGTAITMRTWPGTASYASQYGAVICNIKEVSSSRRLTFVTMEKHQINLAI